MGDTFVTSCVSGRLLCGFSLWLSLIMSSFLVSRSSLALHWSGFRNTMGRNHPWSVLPPETRGRCQSEATLTWTPRPGVKAACPREERSASGSSSLRGRSPAGSRLGARWRAFVYSGFPPLGRGREGAVEATAPQGTVTSGPADVSKAKALSNTSLSELSRPPR